MTGPPDSPWTISFSEKVARQIEELAITAAQQDKEVEFRRSLESVHDRLKNDPVGWGDPEYRLHDLKLIMYRGIEGILLANYAVDLRRRIVYVKQIRISPILLE